MFTLASNVIRTRLYRILGLVVFFAFVGSLGAQQSFNYPVTKKVDHVDTYHGTQVADPYRWLENDTAKDVGDWVKEQNAVTFGYLEKIPFRAQVKERLTQVWNYPRYSAPSRRGKNYFFSKNDGLQNQSVIYIQRGSLTAEPELFLDPNKLSSDGTVALSGSAFSKDGRYYAYAISRSGSDWREIYVMDVETKELLPDKLLWAKFSGMSWRGDGFYYSRYDAPADTTKALTAKNEFHKAYYHRLGTKQEEDILVYEDTKNPLQLIGVGTTEDETRVYLSVSMSGKKGNALYYMDGATGEFKPIITTFDDRISVVNNIDGKLLLYTNRNAPNGKVVLFNPEQPEEGSWQEIIPERPEVLVGISTVGGKLIVTHMKDVRHQVSLFSLDGAVERDLTLPALGTVGGFGGKKEDTETFFTLTSFTSPPTIYRYDIAANTSTLFRKAEIDFDGDKYEAKQVFYLSKDGTRIPMFIVHRKGVTLDGNNPTLLYGYGGFNSSQLPSFSASRLIWLEQGGVYALANLRGGGEYGEKWHEEGMGLKKQNVFDDFIAAAEYLIKEKYTSAARLVIQGGSNGGLLVGAVINQRPDLFRVALPAVGVMDMLRFHKFTIGWNWVPDYGSSDDSVHFKNLYAYSPVHNIRPGVEYPAVLVTTADHDDRVVPAHSFKYIATLQENYRAGTHPVLIRIETNAGHGGGKPTAKIIEEVADLYSFTLYNMGITPVFPAPAAEKK